jgi:diguanylate cyclase (GGDEF)-like protein/PAS domain S-box-containing protein
VDVRVRNCLIAAALFAAVFVARATLGGVGDAIGFLYVIPVVLVATTLGTRGGLAAGGVAFALSSLGTLIEDLPIGALGYANRAVVYLFVGGLTGRFAQTLRALEAESARHFDLSMDMVCVAGFDGYFKRVNPAFERTLGYREAELLGKPFLDFVHPDDREMTEREAAAIAEGAGTVQFRNRYLDSEGEVHWIEWASTPLPDEQLIYAVARDVTDRRLLEAELQRHSHHDSLTGLFNRRRFEEELQRQLAYTRRYGSGGALLVIDIDRFKRINDEHGHATGDRALRAVARVLRDNLRGSDALAREEADAVVARFGGDEFVVLLPEADPQGARAAAERLVLAVWGQHLIAEGAAVPLRISVGVAMFDEHGIPDAEQLFAVADRAMYEAKAAGGGVAGPALAGELRREEPSTGLL